jgi:hypothetical protein
VLAANPGGADYTVLHKHRVVAYIWCRPGQLRRGTYDPAPVCSIPYADVVCLDASALETLAERASEPTIEAFLFALQLCDFEVAKGARTPGPTTRDF